MRQTDNKKLGYAPRKSILSDSNRKGFLVLWISQFGQRLPYLAVTEVSGVRKQSNEVSVFVNIMVYFWSV